jgi:polyisoprenoid-binding protein YceI
MSEWTLTPGTWSLDHDHTTIGAVARHMVITKVRGTFKEFEGDLIVGETPEESSINVTIQAASIDTGVEARDGHLRSPDFLDVERYPTLVFRSTKVEAVGGGRFTVTGDLTIRDITKQITLDAEFEGTAVDPWGGTRAIFSAKAELEREAWGMTWNAALESGGVLVSKTFQLEIETQAVQAQAAAA